MGALALLDEIRRRAGKERTSGLKRAEIERFLELDSSLEAAIAQAQCYQTDLLQHDSHLLAKPEEELIPWLQHGYLNFYGEASVSPYVAAGAAGPWVVSAYGAVIYDTGGYGMLGLGHCPEEIHRALEKPYVMANIMTPSFSQSHLYERLKRDIGLRRKDGCPFDRFVVMNSGSEAVAVAGRIADIHARLMTDPGGAHAGKAIVRIAVERGFHGRTEAGARVSDSAWRYYRQYLASYRERDDLLTVKPNDIGDLKRAFATAEKEGRFVEALFFEPVMGEGRPGVGVEPAFYEAARSLCDIHSTLLVADSIQAGLRCHGVLSVVDYPGFTELPPPDMEVYSKALNGGQFPVSLLALREDVASIYQTGVFGNTMTANPRGLEVVCRVLDAIDEKVRDNIATRGKEFKAKLEDLAKEFPSLMKEVTGTGLLLGAELVESAKVTGRGGLEEWMRLRGVNVIHGGDNALRYTPHYRMTSAEVDLVIAITREALQRAQSGPGNTS